MATDRFIPSFACAQASVSAGAKPRPSAAAAARKTARPPLTRSATDAKKSTFTL